MQAILIATVMVEFGSTSLMWLSHLPLSLSVCGITLHPKCSDQIVKICVTASSDQVS